MVLLLSNLAIFIFITSCGQQKFPNYENEIINTNYNIPDAYFSGKLTSLGPYLRSKINYEMRIDGKQFHSKIIMEHGPINTRIKQYIHTGDKCPGKNADFNKDGQIDQDEVLTAAGEILIPLDRILNSQDEGSEWFPVTNDEGHYYYSRAASVIWMMNDLTDDDVYPQDGIGKLGPGESLDLKNRTLILYGSPQDPLLPIACAEL